VFSSFPSERPTAQIQVQNFYTLWLPLLASFCCPPCHHCPTPKLSPYPKGPCEHPCDIPDRLKAPDLRCNQLSLLACRFEGKSNRDATLVWDAQGKYGAWRFLNCTSCLSRAASWVTALRGPHSPDRSIGQSRSETAIGSVGPAFWKFLISNDLFILKSLIFLEVPLNKSMLLCSF
jgi:hypothetical protein